jgi:hypothetical protein
MKSKTALLVIRVACLVIVGAFFFSYFVVSCSGVEVNISGMEAAFGIDKGEIPLEPTPFLLLIPTVALVVLLALSVPSVREKLKGVKSFDFTLSVAAGAFGLLLLFIAYNQSVGKVREEIGGYGRSLGSVYHTGLGFKASVAAFIVILAAPFADKWLLNKNAPPRDNAPESHEKTTGT